MHVLHYPKSGLTPDVTLVVNWTAGPKAEDASEVARKVVVVAGFIGIVPPVAIAQSVKYLITFLSFTSDSPLSRMGSML